MGKARLILVIGATGSQGGAVVDALRDAGGWRVRALTRQPESKAAQALRAQGVEVVRGDTGDPASLDAAMGGAYGVFSVQASDEDTVTEVRQGRNVVDAAVHAGVSHLVYASSCGAAEPNRGVPYWDSKREIAAYVRSTGIPYTIIRPVSFMANFLGRSRERIVGEGVITGLLTPDKKLQVIAPEDIAAFVLAAFTRREEFLGQEFDVAGDYLTMAEVAETFSRVLGRPVRYVQIPLEGARRHTHPNTLAMNDWYQRVGYQVDIPALVARWGIRPMTLEEWLRHGLWARVA